MYLNIKTPDLARVHELPNFDLHIFLKSLFSKCIALILPEVINFTIKFCISFLFLLLMHHLVKIIQIVLVKNLKLFNFVIINSLRSNTVSNWSSEWLLWHINESNDYTYACNFYKHTHFLPISYESAISTN